ncbi:MAG: hypothetical protein P4L53_08960 [Candidatus Obscuribacterales bacterium]|nr:hypothetical protein [Candidatus Obscuribacterales bacterium]
MARERLISIREAAAVAGVDVELLRREIEGGSLKGEKKNGWFFDEWFVHSSEIEGLKARKKSRPHSKSQETTPQPKTSLALPPTPPLESFWQEVETQPGPSEESSKVEGAHDWREEYKNVTKRVAEELMRPLLERLEVQTIALQEKDALIESQRQQLLLLPDYQLREEQNRQALATKEKQLDLFETKLDLLEEKFTIETAILKSNLLEKDALVNEKVLETNELTELISLKDCEQAILKAQLVEMENLIEDLRQPWWKKLFSK